MAWSKRFWLCDLKKDISWLTNFTSGMAHAWDPAKPMQDWTWQILDTHLGHIGTMHLAPFNQNAALSWQKTNCHFPVPCIFGSKLPVPKPKKYQVTRLDPWFFKIYRELIDEGTIKTQQLEKTKPGCLGFLLRFFFFNLPTYIRGFFHKPS